MNLPDIKSGLFRTVLFANKPNKLKAANVVMRRTLKSINDVKMQVLQHTDEAEDGVVKRSVYAVSVELWLVCPYLHMEPLRIP